MNPDAIAAAPGKDVRDPAAVEMVRSMRVATMVAIAGGSAAPAIMPTIVTAPVPAAMLRIVTVTTMGTSLTIDRPPTSRGFPAAPGAAVDTTGVGATGALSGTAATLLAPERLTRTSSALLTTERFTRTITALRATNRFTRTITARLASHPTIGRRTWRRSIR